MSAATFLNIAKSKLFDENRKRAPKKVILRTKFVRLPPSLPPNSPGMLLSFHFTSPVTCTHQSTDFNHISWTYLATSLKHRHLKRRLLLYRQSVARRPQILERREVHVCCANYRVTPTKQEGLFFLWRAVLPILRYHEIVEIIGKEVLKGFFTSRSGVFTGLWVIDGKFLRGDHLIKQAKFGKAAEKINSAHTEESPKLKM